ncbi:MAG TPA: hypothetical protein VFL86_19005 [Burkholderiaceae bacterium]|nr:hypothetical protein [Burkholderiaceae bacterium]
MALAPPSTGTPIAHPATQAALNDAALALGVPAPDARRFARTGEMQLGDACLMLLPLDPRPQSPWVAVVQRPRPGGVDEPAWLDTLLRANAHLLLAEDASFALAENGDTVLLQRLPGVDNALLLSAALYGALLLSDSVQPAAAQPQAGRATSC